MRTRFTRHGYCRLRQRLFMKPYDVATVLDRGDTVDIGRDPIGGVVHRLFFSRCDKKYFVALQNPDSGAVVTVLPARYERSFRGHVNKKMKRRARRLVKRKS